MRILTGGFAVWMGGWTVQIHHHRDIIGPGMLVRSDVVMDQLKAVATPYDADHLILPAVWALADGLIHCDHGIFPADEIDPDYLEGREDHNLRNALLALGADSSKAEILMQPYIVRLDPEHPQICFR